MLSNTTSSPHALRLGARQTALVGLTCLPPRSAAPAPVVAHRAPRSVQVMFTSGSAGANGFPVSQKTNGYTPRTQPSEESLAAWRTADAVCFDVDCTVTVNDSLDLLAEFMGCKEEVEELTNKAMDGTVTLSKSLEQRLDIINCTPADIRRFIKAHPPTTRLVPGIEELVRVLHERGVAVYLISGGFREVILPVAAHLGVPKERVLANRMNWQWDDETGMPTKLVGFDETQLTAHNRGKPAAIARIRKTNPYDTIVMVGDGITDLEAVQEPGGADLFVGYGGVIERPSVASQAEWFIYSHKDLTKSFEKKKASVPLGTPAVVPAGNKLKAAAASLVGTATGSTGKVQAAAV